MTWCATPGTGADEVQHLAEHERLTRAGRGRASHHTIKDRASHRARERTVRREMADCLLRHRAQHLRRRDTLRHSEALSRHSLATLAALSALSRHSLGGALLPRGALPCHRPRQPSVSCFRMINGIPKALPEWGWLDLFKLACGYVQVYLTQKKTHPPRNLP